jgi:hypothetical protein
MHQEGESFRGGRLARGALDEMSELNSGGDLSRLWTLAPTAGLSLTSRPVAPYGQLTQVIR